jgi:hypothetical protein
VDIDSTRNMLLVFDLSVSNQLPPVESAQYAVNNSIATKEWPSWIASEKYALNM